MTQGKKVITFGFGPTGRPAGRPQKLQKSQKYHKMGPRASKIQDHGIILTDFDPKITFPTSIRVRNVTFDRFLKIFGKKSKNRRKNRKIIFFKISKKMF